MTSPQLAAFIDLGDPCDGCDVTRWPKSVEYLDDQWMTVRYRCRPCGREWNVGWRSEPLAGSADPGIERSAVSGAEAPEREGVVMG
jgi:hypothetical protein